MELPPRDANHDPAFECGNAIALPVGLERRHRQMRLPAIELDDHLFLPPDRIGLDRDLAQRDRAVHFRPRKIFINDQGMERDLHVAAG